MLLCIDIGNTNISIGIFERSSLKASWRIQTRNQATADEYAITLASLINNTSFSLNAVSQVAIVSVVPPLTTAFSVLSERLFNCESFIVNSGIKTGVKIRYDSPRDVGADRVVNAAAACHFYGTPTCIVDFGTGTTFDAINKQGEYIGGAISPGLEISLQALVTRAAKLPKVEIEAPPSAIGKNTVHAVQSGLLFGYVALVEGMVDRFRLELGTNLNIIATGGLANIIGLETKIFQKIDPSLTLKGLELIYRLNN